MCHLHRQVQIFCFDAEEAELLVFREALLLATRWIPHLYNLLGPKIQDHQLIDPT